MWSFILHFSRKFTYLKVCKTGTYVNGAIYLKREGQSAHYIDSL